LFPSGNKRTIQETLSVIQKMETKLLNKIISKLEKKKVSFDNGLSEKEVSGIEEIFNISFPEDLKLFLKSKLPVSTGFTHWRYGLNSDKGRKEITERLNWPLEGLLHSIKGGYFWFDKWKTKPSDFQNQKSIVQQAFKSYPKLIPIYSHRYIPSIPKEVGNPVFSIHQADIIYYGNDLADYFSNEFRFEVPEKFGKVLSPKKINFWSDMVEGNV